MAGLAFIDDVNALGSDGAAFPLGDKGRSLLLLGAELGLPTPAGFVFSCEAEAPDIQTAVEELGRRSGGNFGSGDAPFFLSLRSGSTDRTDGTPDAVLNIGLNDESVISLAAATGSQTFALDSYRRLIQAYGHVVCGIPNATFADRLDGALHLAGVALPTQLSDALLGAVVAQFKQLIADSGSLFPQDPFEQLNHTAAGFTAMARSAASRNVSARSGRRTDVASTFIVQTMVFGNRDVESGTGVAFSRDTIGGGLGQTGSFVFGGQGHDVGAVDAIPFDELATRLPTIHSQVVAALQRLEGLLRDVVELEYTVDGGELYFLQAAVADRSGVAAVRIAVGLVDDESVKLTKEQALGLVSSDHLDQILHKQFAAGETAVVARGLGASPGAAVGRVYFDADRAVDAYDDGEDVILVATETSPEDVHGMAIAEGILTAKGGLASHAAVVARGWGKPAVCGAQGMTVSEHSFEVGGVVVVEGDLISLDGASGLVYLGAVDMSESETPAEFEKILAWADEIRAGKLGVRANADSPEDAAKARQFGAEGIGLCRTEHQFLGERLPLVQRFILAGSADEETEALVELAEAQRSDFEALLKAMDGLPVTVRLLDPPLHEFLPNLDDLLVKGATDGLSDTEQTLLAAATYWHEENPMLGVRGVRLGILRSGLYQMQVKALLDAVVARQQAGGSPKLEIMVPLIINERELDLVASWIADEIAAAELVPDDSGKVPVIVGTMIETPRAALTAGTIATRADFFSFGTNDLTQMTLGFSRDDIESKIMGTYLDRGILDVNPFESLDREGVGALVHAAAVSSRAANPAIKLGVCGEHGGEARSIAAFWAAGLDYVSCSPYRVPIARLAAANAIIANPDRVWS